MVEYIERDTVLKKLDVRKKLLDARLRECKPCDPSYNMYAYQINELIEARGFVSSALAAQVAPAVYGTWIQKDYMIPHCECSVCQGEVEVNDYWETTPYCPWCGAKMDEEEK